MQIVYSGINPAFPLKLHHVDPGEVVQFETNFNRAHADDDLFLVLKVPGEYIKPEKRRTDDGYKVLVSNLDTGLSSLVEQKRRVRRVPAKVVVDE